MIWIWKIRNKIKNTWNKNKPVISFCLVIFIMILTATTISYFIISCHTTIEKRKKKEKIKIEKVYNCIDIEYWVKYVN